MSGKMGKEPWLKGQLLLDGGKLTGSFFHRAVVLICHHDDEGAFGLVLNRASENRAGDLLEGDLPGPIAKETIFAGGPVQPAALSYLYSAEYLPDANVFSGLKLAHSLDELIALGDTLTTHDRIRLFAGYAGWSPGQLEEEMRREAWLKCPATLDLVFHASPDALWRSIMKGMTWRERLLAEAPDDLSWN